MLRTLGHHLLIDATTRSVRGLSDIDHVRALLVALTGTLKMTALEPPRVHALPGEAGTGVSGVVLWAESHASIHTWPEHRFFSFDAYACRAFSEDEVLAVLRAHFDVEAPQVLMIQRPMR